MTRTRWWIAASLGVGIAIVVWGALTVGPRFAGEREKVAFGSVTEACEASVQHRLRPDLQASFRGPRDVVADGDRHEWKSYFTVENRDVRNNLTSTERVDFSCIVEESRRFGGFRVVSTQTSWRQRLNPYGSPLPVEPRELRDWATSPAVASVIEGLAPDASTEFEQRVMVQLAELSTKLGELTERIDRIEERLEREERGLGRADLRGASIATPD